MNVLYALYSRYHFNVSDTRLPEHVERGNKDSLFISSVASCSNLWAVVMDAGTNFSMQVFEISQQFLNKVHFFPLVVDEKKGILILVKIFIFNTYFFLLTCRNGLWNSGIRTTILVHLLVLLLEKH